MSSMRVIENSTSPTVELWFVPFDILMLICNALSVILAIFFLIIIILDRTCRTVPMLLAANSCFTILLFATAMILVTSFTLYKDLKQIQYQDPTCIIAGYLIHVTPVAQNYSFLLQGIYRYLLIVYPNRVFWQLARTQLLLIILSWIIAFAFPLEYLLTGQIVYDADNQVCQMLLRLSFSVIYMGVFLFGMPVFMLMFIYFALVRYVKKMNTRVTPANTLIRAQRNLRMIRRTIILIMIVLMVCFPYQLFVVLSFFNRTPKYNFRIAFIFGDISILCVIITLFLFTDPLEASVRRVVNRLTERYVITPVIT